MSASNAHGARVVVPPPLLFVAGMFAGLGIHRIAPGDELPASIAGAAGTAGYVLAAAGLAFGLWGVATFFRSKTTVIPHRAVSNLVERGPYRVTRNPMYVGLTALYAGLALAQNRLWPFALLPIVLAVLIVAVIRPEERYLEERFGEEYRAYKRRVRRFL